MNSTRILLTGVLYTFFLCSQLPAKDLDNDYTSPNIVFIFADDLGYGDLSCYGATEIDTPNIDRLGSEGIRFTDFYASSSICSPSRAGLLTGRYAPRMGIEGVFFPMSFTGLDPEEVTIAEFLHQNGYATGMVGKWHLGHHYKYLPLQNGFDEYFGIPYSNDMRMVVYMRGNEVEAFEVDQRYLTQRYTAESIEFIEKHREEPFFLYIAHNMPHVPLYCSPKFAGSSKKGLYGDVIQELDWSVGQILETLEKNGLSENTLVIFSSDNGPWLVMEHLGGSAGKLRGGKFSTFEGGFRVPTLARWPNNIPAGTVCDTVANMLDWAPTFASLIGTTMEGKGPLDGKDLSSVLMQNGQREDDRFFYLRPNGELGAVRNGRWKLKLKSDGFPGTAYREFSPAHEELLFDLERDPIESADCADQYPDIVNRLKNEAKAFVSELEATSSPTLVQQKYEDHSHYEQLGKQ